MILIGPDKSLLSTQAYLLQDMLLVIGDSFAHRLTGQLAASDNVTAQRPPWRHPEERVLPAMGHRLRLRS